MTQNAFVDVCVYACVDICIYVCAYVCMRAGKCVGIVTQSYTVTQLKKRYYRKHDARLYEEWERYGKDRS